MEAALAPLSEEEKAQVSNLSAYEDSVTGLAGNLSKELAQAEKADRAGTGESLALIRSVLSDAPESVLSKLTGIQEFEDLEKKYVREVEELIEKIGYQNWLIKQM